MCTCKFDANNTCIPECLIADLLNKLPISMCIFLRFMVTNDKHANISWDIVFCRQHFSENVQDSHVVVFPMIVVVAYGTGFNHVTMNVHTHSNALPFVGNYKFLERILKMMVGRILTP